MDKITENLYIGDIQGASNLMQLKLAVTPSINQIIGNYSHSLSCIRVLAFIPICILLFSIKK